MSMTLLRIAAAVFALFAGFMFVVICNVHGVGLLDGFLLWMLAASTASTINAIRESS